MKTRRVHIHPGPELDTRRVREAVEVLEHGGVVALPTETVYGLCCRSSHTRAVNRIFALKKRPRSKPLPYLIADLDQVFGFVEEVPFRAQRLMGRFWPGPLTLILGDDPGVALRLPDQEFTREVLRRTSGTVVATSANLSGRRPATSGGRVLRQFPEDVDLVVDAGRSRLKEASTIVRLAPGRRPVILREGAFAAEIRSAAAATVVLVCSGNTCRSPMASAILADLLARRLRVRPAQLEELGLRVLSVGLFADEGLPASRQAVTVAAHAGLDLSSHRSRGLTPDLAGEADLVLVMTRHHLNTLGSRFPEAARCAQLLDPEGHEVADPAGGSEDTYRQCFQELHGALESRLEAVLSLAPVTRPPP